MSELQVQPPNVTFPIHPTEDSTIVQKLVNSGSTRISWKIKTTHTDKILAAPVFGVLGIGDSANVTYTGRFKEHPGPGTYRIYVYYIEPITGLTNADGQEVLKGYWSHINNTESKRHTVVVGFDPQQQQQERAPQPPQFAHPTDTPPNY